jgi:hypothetical protein
MRAVRCDVCGTKALTAASKCPGCGHMFAVRDGFGDLLPLAYCPTCDSYYPETVGSCRWCGTKPEHAPRAPYIWKGIGVAALVVLAVGAWFMRDTRPEDAADARTAALLKQAATPTRVDTPDVRAPIAPVDTVATHLTMAIAPAPVDPPPAATPAPSPASLAPSAAPASAPSLARSPAPASAKAQTSARWINSVAKSWVVVRADARKGARIVASIGPDSRVQLGETRGSWRRIKARGIAGWVEPRALFVAVRPSKRANGLASR